ncbi:MAG: biotin/lipoyl-containing protein, partial [Burkholderiaceae bacterium]
MAIVDVKVPQLSESVAEATLMQWKKKVGDTVTADEILIEIETDKVVLEVPAPSSGVLSELVQPDGATVAAEQVIAHIDTSGGAVAAAQKPAADKPAAAKPVAAPASAPAAAAPAASRIAMPAAEKMMADNKLDPASVTGTGKDGRITKGDVVTAMAKPAPVAAAPVAQVVPRAATLLPQVNAAQPNLGERPEQRVPMSRLRARIAERLLQSQSSAAILTTFNEVNMAPVMEMRKRFQEKFEKEHGVKIGFMSFFVKAAVHALKKYP